jgi:transcriptional regulator, merR family
MKINEVAEVSGVSSRTLHYYYEIGLLKPTKLENGYRGHTANDLDKL